MSYNKYYASIFTSSSNYLRFISRLLNRATYIEAHKIAINNSIYFIWHFSWAARFAYFRQRQSHKITGRYWYNVYNVSGGFGVKS